LSLGAPLHFRKIFGIFFFSSPPSMEFSRPGASTVKGLCCDWSFVGDINSFIFFYLLLTPFFLQIRESPAVRTLLPVLYCCFPLFLLSGFYLGIAGLLNLRGARDSSFFSSTLWFFCASRPSSILPRIWSAGPFFRFFFPLRVLSGVCTILWWRSKVLKVLRDRKPPPLAQHPFHKFFLSAVTFCGANRLNSSFSIYGFLLPYFLVKDFPRSWQGLNLEVRLCCATPPGGVQNFFHEACSLQ